MNKAKIKEIARGEIISALKYYEVDDFAIENMNEKERDIFFQEFEKMKEKIIKDLKYKRGS